MPRIPAPPLTSIPGKAGRAVPAGSTSATAVARQRPRARLIALLIAGPLICVIGLTTLASVGLNQQARQTATQAATSGAMIGRSALLADGGTAQISGGQIASGGPQSGSALNNNNALAQRMRNQAGVDILVVQQEQGALVVIASSLAAPHGSASPAGLGERLTGSFAATACSAGAPGAAVTVAGKDYLGGTAPLVDASGACVGAVVGIVPASASQAGPTEYTIILALAGALLSLLTVAIGMTLHARGALGDTVDIGNARALVAAADEAAAALSTQAAKREWVARRVDAGRGNLVSVMESLVEDRIALQEATSELWAGVSHPGAPVDPTLALRLARQGAVVSARIGSRLEDLDSVTSVLLADMATADDADHALRDALAQTERAVRSLAAITSGAPERDSAQAATVRRDAPAPEWQNNKAIDPYATGKVAALPSDPFATGRVPAMPRQSWPQSARDPQARGDGGQGKHGTGAYGIVRPETGAYRAVRPEAGGSTPRTLLSGQYARGQTGQGPAVGPLSGDYGSTSQPRTGSSGPAGGPASANGGGRFTPRPGAGNGTGSGANGQSGNLRPPNPYSAFTDNRDRESSGSRWLND